MPSALESLGINLPQPPAGGVPTSPEQERARAEAQQGVPTGGQQSPMINQKDLAETIVAGCISVLEQALAFYGATSEDGRKILRAMSILQTIVPPERIREASAMLSGLAPGMGAGAPPLQTPPPGLGAQR